jgi:hypothetical protein
VKPPFDLQSRWPRELRLLAAAAVRRYDAAARARCEALAAEGVDWPRLRELASAHGLAPLLSRNLGSLPAVPVEVAGALHAELSQNLRFSLSLAAELARLCGALRHAGISAVSFKGPALAQRLYGNVGLRCFSDLDLLVEASERERASEVLVACGYRRIRRITDRARQTAGDCEEEFLSQDGRLLVDLHWEIAQPYYSVGPLPAGWKARLRHIAFGEEQVATFGDSDNLLVLALHGSKHRWERLAWLADFSGALDAGGFDWDAVLLAAGEMRVRYYTLLAATLAHFVLGAEVPEKILLAAYDAGTPWRLAAEIVDSHASDAPLPLLARWSYGFRMRESWSDRARVAVRFLTRPSTPELEDSPLAAGHAFLYPALRAKRIAGRAWKAAVGGHGGSATR